jgi:hypothetical protein
MQFLHDLTAKTLLKNPMQFVGIRRRRRLFQNLDLLGIIL